MNRLDAEQILQIATTGLSSYSREDLKRIYRRLAKQYHPDFSQGETPADSRASAQQMARINEAYDHLISCFDQLNEKDARLSISKENAWVKDQFGWAHSTADNSAHTAAKHSNNDASTTWAQASTAKQPSSSSGASSEDAQKNRSSQSVHAQVAHAWREMDAQSNASHQSSYKSAHNHSDGFTHRHTSAWAKRSAPHRYTHYTDAYVKTPQRAAEFAREVMSEKHRESRRVIVNAARTPQAASKHPLRRFTTKPVAKAFWSMTPLRIKVYLTCALCAVLVFITALIAYLMLDLPAVYAALVALLLLLVIYCLTPQPSGFITQMILANNARMDKKRRSHKPHEDADVIEGQAQQIPEK